MKNSPAAAMLSVAPRQLRIAFYSARLRGMTFSVRDELGCKVAIAAG